MSRIPSTVPIQQTATSGGNRGLHDVDLDQFLQLLITELRNQDPLSPMENSELLQQIGQIRSIGATNKLTETLDAVLLGQNVATASSLIGKRIEALSEEFTNIEGVVDRVSVDQDPFDDSARLIRVHVGESTVRLDNIRAVLGD